MADDVRRTGETPQPGCTAIARARLAVFPKLPDLPRLADFACGWRVARQAAIGIWNSPRQGCRQM